LPLLAADEGPTVELQSTVLIQDAVVADAVLADVARTVVTAAADRQGRGHAGDREELVSHAFLAPRARSRAEASSAAGDVEIRSSSSAVPRR
jgi:hypothetical protein